MTAQERLDIVRGPIPVDPQKPDLAVFVHPDQSIMGTESVAQNFKQLDEAYEADPRGYITEMGTSTVYLGGMNLDLGVRLAGRDEKSQQSTLWMAPLNDGRPETDPDKLYARVAAGKKLSPWEAERVKPNSYNPATKQDIDYRYKHADGNGQPSVQIYAPEAQAFSSIEQGLVASGDLLPYGRLAIAGYQKMAELYRREFGSEAPQPINLFAAGMASKALGAAVMMIENGFQINSLTLMNFSISEDTLRMMGKNYAGRRVVGEASTELFPSDLVRIREPKVRRDIEGLGTDIFSMRGRQAKVLVPHPLIAKSIMQAKRANEYLEKVLASGTHVTIANAHNEPMTAQTETYLPFGEANLHLLDIVGVEGKKVGMASNEHAALVALVGAIGIRNAQH